MTSGIHWRYPEGLGFANVLIFLDSCTLQIIFSRVSFPEPYPGGLPRESPKIIPSRRAKRLKFLNLSFIYLALIRVVHDF